MTTQLEEAAREVLAKYETRDMAYSGRDTDYIVGHEAGFEAGVEALRAALQEHPAPPAVPQEPPRGYAVAPKELWLQLHGDCLDSELDEPVEYKGNEDVTWCWNQIHNTDIRYVRADLTLAAAERPKEPT